MPVNANPISEDDLRAALRPYQADPNAFETAVRRRLEAAERERADEPLALADLSPLLKSVAALLPLALITGCKPTATATATATAARAAPATGISKLLGYIAFPAISLFLLLGATVFSIGKIHGIQGGNRDDTQLRDVEAVSEGVRRWWRYHQWGAWLVWGATIALALVGATDLLFLLYIVSFGLLVYVLASFARRGLGNRQVIGGSCMTGLMLLGQVAGFTGIGDQDIHFVDQHLICLVFFWGALALLPFMGNPPASSPIAKIPLWLRGSLVFALVAALTVWFMNPILWPATPSRIKHYVETFDDAPYPDVLWPRWEPVARWAVDAKLDPDLSSARRLLAREIAGEQNPFVLGSALRVGLVQQDQIARLLDYEDRRRVLLDVPDHIKEAQPISSLNQMDWVIRASVLRNDLSPGERAVLARRLHASFEELSDDTFDLLERALRATQLLELINGPIDRGPYRARVHGWLRSFHCKAGGGFEVAGGFRKYRDARVSSMEATSYAIELMALYGIPDGLDLDWVRSYLRPLWIRREDNGKWIAAVSLDRLNHLPGVTRPSWLAVVYYERSLIAAAVLVGLCIYATLSSPRPRARSPVSGSAME